MHDPPKRTVRQKVVKGGAGMMNDAAAAGEERHNECFGHIDRVLFELVERLRVAIETGLKDSSSLHLSEFNVLHFLAEDPHGSMRLGDLARKLSFSPSRLSYQVRTMEKRGLLARHPSEEDGRGAYAIISNAGREAHAEALAVYRRIIAQVLCAGLGKAEAESLLDMLSRLNESVSVNVINGALRY